MRSHRGGQGRRRRTASAWPATLEPTIITGATSRWRSRARRPSGPCRRCSASRTRPRRCGWRTTRNTGLRPQFHPRPLPRLPGLGGARIRARRRQRGPDHTEVAPRGVKESGAYREARARHRGLPVGEVHWCSTGSTAERRRAAVAPIRKERAIPPSGPCARPRPAARRGVRPSSAPTSSSASRQHFHRIAYYQWGDPENDCAICVHGST